MLRNQEFPKAAGLGSMQLDRPYQIIPDKYHHIENRHYSEHGRYFHYKHKSCVPGSFVCTYYITNETIPTPLCSQYQRCTIKFKTNCHLVVLSKGWAYQCFLLASRVPLFYQYLAYLVCSVHTSNLGFWAVHGHLAWVSTLPGSIL